MLLHHECSCFLFALYATFVAKIFFHLRNKLLRTTRNTHALGYEHGKDSGKIIRRNSSKDEQKNTSESEETLSMISLSFQAS